MVLKGSSQKIFLSRDLALDMNELIEREKQVFSAQVVAI